MSYGIGTEIKTEMARFMDGVAETRKDQGDESAFDAFDVVQFYTSFINDESAEILRQGRDIKRGKVSHDTGTLLIKSATDKIAALTEKMNDELADLA